MDRSKVTAMKIIDVESFGPWFLYKMVAHFTMRNMEQIMHFDLLKAFGYIERVAESHDNI